MLKPAAARLRTYLQAETLALLQNELAAMRAELAALSAETQADRHAYQHTIEKLHEINRANLAAQSEQLAQMRNLFVDLDIPRLLESFEAALLTLALRDETRQSGIDQSRPDPGPTAVEAAR